MRTSVPNHSFSWVHDGHVTEITKSHLRSTLTFTLHQKRHDIHWTSPNHRLWRLRHTFTSSLRYLNFKIELELILILNFNFNLISGNAALLLHNGHILKGQLLL
jgi:hypothetical protein